MLLTNLVDMEYQVGRKQEKPKMNELEGHKGNPAQSIEKLSQEASGREITEGEPALDPLFTFLDSTD